MDSLKPLAEATTKGKRKGVMEMIFLFLIGLMVLFYGIDAILAVKGF